MSLTAVEEGRHDGTPWASFELPAALVSFRLKRREVSVEQRADAARRLAKARSHVP